MTKQLEGWQLGALCVFIVAMVTAVLIPRTAIPEGLPPPQVTRQEVLDARQRNAQLAAQATADNLPSSVQLVGSRLRVLGRAEYLHDDAALSEAAYRLQEARGAMFRKEVVGLAELRAYQAERFSTAYCTYLRTGEISDDLIELGGGAFEEFEKNGWFRPGETNRDLDLMLRAFFKRRFAASIAPGHPSMEPDPVEERLLLGYLIEHPPKSGVPGTAEEQSGLTGEFVIKRIRELSALEPTYPALYATGIVLFRMQRYELAANAFDTFLQSAEAGPYRLRAVNYLKASIERSDGEP